MVGNLFPWQILPHLKAKLGVPWSERCYVWMLRCVHIKVYDCTFMLCPWESLSVQSEVTATRGSKSSNADTAGMPWDSSWENSLPTSDFLSGVLFSWKQSILCPAAWRQGGGEVATVPSASGGTSWARRPKIQRTKGIRSWFICSHFCRQQISRDQSSPVRSLCYLLSPREGSFRLSLEAGWHFFQN